MPLITLARTATPMSAELDAVSRAIARCRAQPVAFDAGAYAPEAVEKARAVWRVRMASEHHSSAVFLRIAIQLIEAGATIDAEAVMTRMAFDELRHAEICGQALLAMGAEACAPAPAAAPPIADHPALSREECALRNVIYSCCMTEAINAARFVATIDRMLDPCLREFLRRLLADEARHASFGYEYLEAWSPWLEARPAVRSSLGDYLCDAFGFVERAMSSGGAPRATPTPDEIALGLPDPAFLDEVFYPTIEHAIVPGLERFGLDARAAWKQRRPARD